MTELVEDKKLEITKKYLQLKINALQSLADLGDEDAKKQVQMYQVSLRKLNMHVYNRRGMTDKKKTVRRKSTTSLVGQQVVMRFFIAVNELVNRDIIRGVKTFTDAYDIDRRNFKLLEEEPERKQFDAGWLTFLVRDFGVNPTWLILGKGAMFLEDEEEIKEFAVK